MELKRDASTIAFQDTLKVFITQKDKNTEKDERDKEKRREREERDKNYFKPQKKKLEIDENNARTRSAEVELAKETQEAAIMTIDLSTSTPKKRAWYEKKQAVYLARDA